MTQPSEPKATANDVRIVGLIFFVVAGTVMFWFGGGWGLEGIIPLPWVGIVLIVVGIAMVLMPEPFRKRVSRLHEIGERFSKKPPNQVG